MANDQAHPRATQKLQNANQGKRLLDEAPCSALDSTGSVDSEGLETIETTVNMDQEGFVGVITIVSDDLGLKSTNYIQTKVNETEWRKFLCGQKKLLVFKVAPDALKRRPKAKETV